MIRLPAAHRWPALLNAERRVQRTASSRSASSQTTSGFLPPSSRESFARRRPASTAISRPTALEPVKLITPTSGFEPGAPPPRGRSRGRYSRRHQAILLLRAIRPNRAAVCGVSSADLRTAAFPQMRAGKTFHATLAIGVLAAMISPATPMGWRTVIANLLATPLVVVLP